MTIRTTLCRSRGQGWQWDQGLFIRSRYRRSHVDDERHDPHRRCRLRVLGLLPQRQTDTISNMAAGCQRNERLISADRRDSGDSVSDERKRRCKCNISRLSFDLPSIILEYAIKLCSVNKHIRYQSEMIDFLSAKVMLAQMDIARPYC